jgi:hypothetical protein
MGIAPLSEMKVLYLRALKVKRRIIGDTRKQDVIQSFLIFLLFLKTTQATKIPARMHARNPVLLI